MFKQAQRTHRVVQNLLSFARQRKPERSEVDIRKVLEETLTLRDYDLKVNNIVVEKNLGEKSALVVADPHQIEASFPEHHQQRGGRGTEQDLDDRGSWRTKRLLPEKRSVLLSSLMTGRESRIRSEYSIRSTPPRALERELD